VAGSGILSTERPTVTQPWPLVAWPLFYSEAFAQACCSQSTNISPFQLPSNCLPTAFQLPSNCLPSIFPPYSKKEVRKLERTSLLRNYRAAGGGPRLIRFLALEAAPSVLPMWIFLPSSSRSIACSSSRLRMPWFLMLDSSAMRVGPYWRLV
jgi:hypothetical protein